MHHHIIGAANQLIIMKYPIFFSSPRGRRTRRAPVRQCVDAPHARIHARSARAAVRGPGGVQFVLGEQGRRSSGPCGTRCPALPFRTFFAHWALGCAASFFFLVPKPSNSCNHLFQSRKRTPDENRSYLAPAVRCRKERPSDRRGVVQQPPAESWEVMRSVKSITSTKHVAHLL